MRKPKPKRAIGTQYQPKRDPYADVAVVNPVRGHKTARIKPYSVTCRNPHRANNSDRYSVNVPFTPASHIPAEGDYRLSLTPERDSAGRYKAERSRRIPTPVHACKTPECRCIDAHHAKGLAR